MHIIILLLSCTADKEPVLAEVDFESISRAMFIAAVKKGRQTRKSLLKDDGVGQMSVMIAPRCISVDKATVD